jgi:hypothetical protein
MQHPKWDYQEHNNNNNNKQIRDEKYCASQTCKEILISDNTSARLSHSEVKKKQTNQKTALTPMSISVRSSRYHIKFPLHYAARTGDLNTIQKLVKYVT